jgi:uncharacterized membrane protein
MVMSIAITLHILSAVIWVGGMFFAYMCLRPVAAKLLEPPIRLSLWTDIFARFFNWVWVSVILLIITGHWMILNLGGIDAVSRYIIIMQVSGYVMITLYLYVFFVPYQALKKHVEGSRWQEAGSNLNRIRRIVAINVLLGLFTILTAAAGR